MSGRIALPQVPAGAAIPQNADSLRFHLTSITVEGEYPRLAKERRELSEKLTGRQVTVADLFRFADQLQQIYVRAGYPLARVVILPQEFGKRAAIRMRVIDGFVESINLETIAEPARQRIAIVLAPLIGRGQLMQGDLERALLIAGETPGVVLNATFAGGRKTGGSVLVLSGRYRPISASVYSDNSLPASFGTGQVVTTVSLNGVAGVGEQLVFTTSGLPDRDFTSRYPTRRYMNGSLAVPLGQDGWKFEIGGTDGVTTPRVSANVATQGRLSQLRAKLSYDIIKRRDFTLNASGSFEGTNEEIDTLVLSPSVPLSIDRTRVLRLGTDSVWNWRETGTSVSFGGAFSRGLSGFGERRASDATPALPLSRAGADSVFSKMSFRFEIMQPLGDGFFVALNGAGQTSFNTPMLTSEQFDVSGSKLLSGFTGGALAGDRTWGLRTEFGYSRAIPFGPGGVTAVPYVFTAYGERYLENPSVVETASVHAVNYGLGTRFTLAPWADWSPDGYAFIEYSRRKATLSTLDGDRIFTGMLLRY